MKPMWYEIHLTVLAGADGIFRFKELAAAGGAKPIVIELEASSGILMQSDVMTSSKVFGSESEAFTHAESLSRFLRSGGFEIVRIKIESEPGHSKAPQVPGDAMPENCYFESHIQFLCSADDRARLQDVAVATGAKLSRNPFKKTDQGEVVMLTLRDYESPFSTFRERLEFVLSTAKGAGLVPHKKIEVEFAVHDSNWKHDHAWAA